MVAKTDINALKIQEPIKNKNKDENRPKIKNNQPQLKI